MTVCLLYSNSLPLSVQLLRQKTTLEGLWLMQHDMFRKERWCMAAVVMCLTTREGSEKLSLWRSVPHRQKIQSGCYREVLYKEKVQSGCYKKVIYSEKVLSSCYREVLYKERRFTVAVLQRSVLQRKMVREVCYKERRFRAAAIEKYSTKREDQRSVRLQRKKGPGGCSRAVFYKERRFIVSYEERRFRARSVLQREKCWTTKKEGSEWLLQSSVLQRKKV